MATAGDRIDKFTLVRQLGAGGMGATWEAVRQVGTDFEQRVAIKLAAPEVLGTKDGLASFRREAALAASLRHPNIAAVLDVDEQAGYIVCELVDGADLRTVLRTVPGGRLDSPVVVHLLAQIARGLCHAHRRILRGRPSPVIHRDMSPGNVVVDYDGNVKIVDFGIAKVLAGGAEIVESVKGKLAYMAPEQAMGARMDGRVDQYALGVIAYEALSGVRPNQGAHEAETLASMLGGHHLPLRERVPGLPPTLCRCVERMLAVRPEERFPHMDAVLDALAEFTPKLTIHRALVPLVVAARQPHTILRENGRFVSRPVEAEPLLRVCASGAAEVAAPRSDVLAGGNSALAVTLGNTRAHDIPVPTPVSESPSAQPRAQPPELPRPKSKRAPAHGASGGSRARLFWHAMTVLGVSLLAGVVWVAVSPELFQAPADVPLGMQPGMLSRAASELVATGDDPERTAEADRPADTALAATRRAAYARRARRVTPDLAPARVQAGDAAAHRATQYSSSAAPGALDSEMEAPSLAPARITVRVLPEGRVWLDGMLLGLAEPELEIEAPPGEHVLAVGRGDGPTERRSLQLQAEQTQTIQFELSEPQVGRRQ